MVPWTVTHQAPLPMKFSRQECWSGVPGDLPDPGLKPASFESPVLAGKFLLNYFPELLLKSETDLLLKLIKTSRHSHEKNECK